MLTPKFLLTVCVSFLFLATTMAGTIYVLSYITKIKFKELLLPAIFFPALGAFLIRLLDAIAYLIQMLQDFYSGNWNGLLNSGAGYAMFFLVHCAIFFIYLFIPFAITGVVVYFCYKEGLIKNQVFSSLNGGVVSALTSFLGVFLLKCIGSKIEYSVFFQKISQGCKFYRGYSHLPLILEIFIAGSLASFLLLWFIKRYVNNTP